MTAQLKVEHIAGRPAIAQSSTFVGGDLGEIQGVSGEEEQGFDCYHSFTHLK